MSPLGRVLGWGSAKEGVEHWWAQRLTAVALVPLGIWLAVAFAGLEDFSYASVVGLIQAPLNSVFLILTLVTLTYHSHLGVQVVIEDYVHSAGLKILMLVLVSFAHVAVAVGGVFAALKIAFGVTG